MTPETPPSPPPPRRVLIIKPSALGDVVTALPVLRGLRRTFPEAHVSWLLSTSCAALRCARPESSAARSRTRSSDSTIHETR